MENPVITEKTLSPVIIYFCAPIIQPATARLRSAICHLINKGHGGISIFMASSGGAVDEGLALYGFFRTLPVEVTIHNIAHIDSIAVAAYLGADKRVASPTSTFLIHDFYFGQPLATVTRSQVEEQALAMSTWRNKMRSLFKIHTNITNEMFEQTKLLDKPRVEDASVAVKVGIAHKVAEAVVPLGTELINIEY